MRIILASLLIALALVGCATRSPAPPVATQPAASDVKARDIARRSGLNIVGSAESTTATLPDELTEFPWLMIQWAVQREKRDLRPYAGQVVVLTSYELSPSGPDGRRRTFTVVRQGDSILGAFVGEEGLSGGPASVSATWTN
jgi:hypothetical protein